jgi:hypothetical protein
VIVCVVDVEPSVATSTVVFGRIVIVVPRPWLSCDAPADDWVTAIVWLPSARSFDAVAVPIPSAFVAATR